MLKYLPLLKEINKCGYLTTNSQAGNTLKVNSVFDNTPYVYRERAYICGYMTLEKASKFIYNLSVNTDKQAICLTPIPESIADKIPRSLNIPLTLEDNKNVIKSFTHMGTSLSFQNDYTFRKEIHLNKNDPSVFIFCWDPIWERIASD